MTRRSTRSRAGEGTFSVRALVAAILVVAFALSPTLAVANAREMFQRFLDPEDGQLDLSEWLLDRRGFLPVPIIITEPAVGFGGGVALVFISETFREVADRAKAAGGHITPPNIFAIGGFATENGTKGALIGGQFTFDEDRWRYRGGIGDFSINLDFYGVGGQLPIPIEKIGYNLKGLGSFQQGMYRLGESSTFVGRALGLRGHGEPA